MQAEQDYSKNPDTLQVRIQIRYTQTYASALMPPPPCQGAIHMNAALDCFHDFQFRFRQEKQIEPVSSYGIPIYSAHDMSGLTGGDIWFTFRTTAVASAPLRVEISTPDGHEVSATFDLAALRSFSLGPKRKDGNQYIVIIRQLIWQRDSSNLPMTPREGRSLNQLSR